MLPCTPPIASALPRLDLSPWLKYVCSRLNCNFTTNNKKIRLTIRHHSNYHWELPIILTTTTLMTIIIVTFSTSCLAMVGSPSALFTSSLSWPHSVWHLHKKEKKAISRVEEVAREHGWHPPKSLDLDKNFKLEHTLFCRKLRFVAIYALFGDLWAKKCLLGSITVFLGQEVHYYMVYIAYFTELILQICDYAQKRRICRENYKYALDENFHCHCQVLPPCL